ncbi:cobalt ECF transporter T component CbiQ [Heliorestis convoluta]|uniref:Cobalt ABC transporter, permease protein CbiQ n=1 Tax=Heliorestis convoluta TaxID=356322 RepID=A0A5Q2MZ90_9FIRM|nr:cobalt ECF transporter T component CbiQ [Heliorestis convoluta]QGG46242.1 cobalt ABC transporter, permease protein CbiQ [Heliorestis convoluta]
MGLKLDPYVAGHRWLHRWDPRYKFLGFMVLIFAFALVQNVLVLPAMLLVTVFLFFSSSLPFQLWLSRIKVPAFFLLALALLLPFFAGEKILWQAGPFALRLEGLVAFLLIAGKLTSILTLVLVLFGTTPMLMILKAMRHLGLPELMADMVHFTYRYLFQLQEDYERQSTAARLRGYRSDSIASITTTSYLLGSLLVRSYDQAERVYKAMRLRGYGQHAFYIHPFQSQPKDLWLFAATTMIALAFAFLGYP